MCVALFFEMYDAVCGCYLPISKAGRGCETRQRWIAGDVRAGGVVDKLTEALGYLLVVVVVLRVR